MDKIYFLEKLNKLAECGLIISLDKDLVSWLKEQGFSEISNISDIRSGGSYYIFLQSLNNKYWYDFCVQFSIGAIKYTENDSEKLLDLNPLDTKIIIISNGEFYEPDIRKVTGISINI